VALWREHQGERIGKGNISFSTGQENFRELAFVLFVPFVVKLIFQLRAVAAL
jgi:hypothetical protein